MTLKPSHPDSFELAWFKSSYSGSDDNDCVETAVDSSAVHVRDSKDADGPRLAFTAASWAAFVPYVAAR